MDYYSCQCATNFLPKKGPLIKKKVENYWRSKAGGGKIRPVKAYYLALNLPFWLKFGPRDTYKGSNWPRTKIVAHHCPRGPEKIFDVIDVVPLVRFLRTLLLSWENVLKLNLLERSQKREFAKLLTRWDDRCQKVIFRVVVVVVVAVVVVAVAAQ